MVSIYSIQTVTYLYETCQHYLQKVGIKDFNNKKKRKTDTLDIKIIPGLYNKKIYNLIITVSKCGLLKDIYN